MWGGLKTHLAKVLSMRASISSRVWCISQTTRTFLCILRYHCRCGLLQQYEQLLEDMIGPGEARANQMDRTRMENALTGDRNSSISCELGVRYLFLLAMMNREDLRLRLSVCFCFYKNTSQFQCICCRCTIHTQCIYNVYTAYNSLIYCLK